MGEDEVFPLAEERVRSLKDFCPQGVSLSARVNQGMVEKTTRPIVQRDLIHVLERVGDLEMERVMDPSHGLEGGLKPGGVGRLLRGPFEDPAWACFRGPLLVAQEDGDAWLGPSRQGINEAGHWVDSIRPEESQSSAKIPLFHQEAEASDPRNDRQCPVRASRYELVPLEQSPSTIFSVFGRPLLIEGFSGRGDVGGAVEDMEPLRVISKDGRE